MKTDTEYYIEMRAVARALSDELTRANRRAPWYFIAGMVVGAAIAAIQFLGGAA